jgi:hypothetical protein
VFADKHHQHSVGWGAVTTALLSLQVVTGPMHACTQCPTFLVELSCTCCSLHCSRRGTACTHEPTTLTSTCCTTHRQHGDCMLVQHALVPMHACTLWRHACMQCMSRLEPHLIPACTCQCLAPAAWMGSMAVP